ncbi:hypothetical protein D9619_000188 [Psilocybe cf. subviscida]|uniref:Major facilitator superfamily (MFS) profile domain-containing protein n=1 Tax=Psilocybe cf. subviscida TaxID=2480587 RepID=A0A8H5F3K4_9AGAR|nr:hypothetical protein D9619_000188 [Psilocybe cf. subviscida]
MSGSIDKSVDDVRKEHYTSASPSSQLDVPPELAVSQLVARDTTPWYQKPNLRMLYMILFPTCLGVEMSSGYDASMMNGLQVVDSWDTFYHHPRSVLLGVMSAMYFAGAICSLPFVPIVADGLGRRWSIITGSLIMIFGASLQAASQDFAMFVIARFVLGFGISFAIVAASSLLGELGHPKERAILGSLFNSCYYIGAIVAAGITLGTFSMKTNWGWRIPSLLQMWPNLLQITFVTFLPESPRWLISKGRGDEARAILVKYHAEGDETSEFVKAEYFQIETTLELEKEAKKVGWGALLRTSGMRRRVLIAGFLGLATQWSGNGLTSYFLGPILQTVGITSNHTKNLVNVAYTIWSFINATILALTMSRFKRRTIYLTCTISLSVVFTAWTIASAKYAMDKSQASSKAVIALIFLYSPAYNVAYNALSYAFLVELFPFHVRTKGIAVFQWFSRMAGFFNQFVNPIGIANAGSSLLSLVFYCIFLLFEVAFVFFLFPETSGRSLEELAFLYEEDELQKQKQRVEEEIRNPPPGFSKAKGL